MKVLKATLILFIEILFITKAHMQKTEGQETLRKVSAMVPDTDDDDTNSLMEKRRIVNFASVTAGAVVLESSPQSVGYHNLLSDDKDK